MYMQDSSSAWQLPSSSTCTSNNNTAHYWSGVELHLTVAEDDPQSLHAAAPEVTFPVSIVLLPGPENQSQIKIVILSQLQSTHHLDQSEEHCVQLTSQLTW